MRVRLKSKILHSSYMHQDIIQTIARIQTSKKEIFFQIFLIFVVPILCINLGIISISFRVPLLIILVSVLVIVLFKESWTFSMLGIRRQSLGKYFIPYLIFTAVGVFAVTQLGEKIGQEEIIRWWTYDHFLYLFFVVSLFQEVAYRGYLVPALGKLALKPPHLLWANVLLFTLLHTIFPHPLIALPLAFVAGLSFALMYMKYPNLPLIIISHSILNFATVLYGFFVVPGVTF